MTSSPEHLYLLSSSREEGLDEDPDWLDQVGWSQVCPGCARRRAGLYPKPLEAVVWMRQRASISDSGRTCIRILRRPLFELLRRHEPRIVGGEVRFHDGRTQRDSVTVHCPLEMEIVLRGGPGSRANRAYGLCSACGRRKAARALFTDPWYVLRRDIPRGDVFITNAQDLVVTEHLKGTADFSAFKDLVFRPILVLDEPLEPIPEFGDKPGAPSEGCTE